ncbi:C4-dicarboxylic acid, orotate and citrate transporter [Legionella steigerwaltii]|uniref:C4-dicarboxylic acid, orotate and citrate transporter n=2 Tax=Legionella steigerwaltii TaxID=460 RepID=A0A378LGK5_9GAMM|nr:C4-dicarboxylate transporter DctA [Legionella steigerwaltii]KTD81110.1 C4-dicarboxylic acid, orotate and citrate transporter [Legionella steigerwaltii]STY23201.1 C4-dicarboxylic acid, orotate and citrate transporter [Legionella steigerwaltii]
MKVFKLYKQPYFQILFALFIGIVLGYFYPDLATKMKPLGEGFIKLIRAVVPLIIFSTVVMGILKLKNIREAGRIGIKGLIYFEVVTTIAMFLGLAVANYFQPGAGLNIDIHSLDKTSIPTIPAHTAPFNLTDFILSIIPDTLISAFTQGNTLQILFVSTLLGFGLLRVKDKTQPVINLIEQLSEILFSIVALIMKMAPIGAFGAIAYTIGTHGTHFLVMLSKLLVCFYLTCIFFICIILGLIAKLFKFNLWIFLKHIKEELLIVLGTASTEVVLPRMISKLEKIGCNKSIAGFILPAGYAFNLDGMSIYLTMALMFLAQVFHLHFDFQQQIMIVVMLMLIAKGAANVTGGGFIALATAVTSMHIIPAEGLVLLLGIDRFISEARALTNLIGNGVATMVIAKWEDDFNSPLNSHFKNELSSQEGGAPFFTKGEDLA